MTWLLAICSALASCAVQADLPREVVLLSRIRRNVHETLARLPNYTCLESIERFTRSSASHPFVHADSIEIEVAHVGDRELFARPGAPGFEAEDPSEVVGSGLTESGQFALHLSSIFETQATTITWDREEDVNGRRALRYSFRLPLFASGWVVRLGHASGTVAARGSFWADAVSLEVFRIEVWAVDIPPDLAVADLVSRVDYARMRIGDSEELLPQTGEVVLTQFTGRQDRNITEFSHCRQYLGESVISYVDSAISYAEPKSVDIQIPAGLALRLQLVTGIDLTKAHVGDLVSARVAAAAIKGRVVVPVGAVLKGRIRRLERGSAPGSHIVVGLEFTELQFDNKRAQFFGRLESLELSPGVRRMPGDARQLPGVATLVLPAGHSTLPRNLGMLWQTQSPSR